MLLHRINNFKIYILTYMYVEYLHIIYYFKKKTKKYNMYEKSLKMLINFKQYIETYNIISLNLKTIQPQTRY